MNIFIVIGGCIAGILVLNIALFAPTALLLYGTFDKFTVSNVDNQSFSLKISNFLFNKPIAQTPVEAAKLETKSTSSKSLSVGEDNANGSNFSYHNGIHLYDSSISFKQDRMVRLCCINYELHKSKIHQDETLFNYLSKHEKESFLDIKPKDIRMNNKFVVKKEDLYKVYLDERVLNLYLGIWQETTEDVEHMKTKLNDPIYTPTRYEVVSKTELFVRRATQIFAFGATFILFPIWCLSRLFFLMFPFIVIIDSYIKDTLPGIDSIQFILTIAYWTFSIAWIIAFYNVWQYYFWIHHVAVGGYFSLWQSNANKCFDDILHRYNKLSQVLIVKKIIFDSIGKDIGSIVFHYWVHIELGEENIKKPLKALTLTPFN